MHVDFYSDDSTDLGVFVISPGNESEYLLIPSGTLGQWNSVDIPLSHYTTTDLTDVFQLKFDGDGTIVLDNIYFHGTNPDGPSVGLNHIFDGGFGNAVRSTETENLHTFPTGAEGWAGWKFNGDDVWPLTFGSGGSVTITASVPDGGSANVSLHLERENYPNHNPEYEINNIQVSGAVSADYHVVIPAQYANTYSSIAMYIAERDIPVSITDVTFTTSATQDAPNPVITDTTEELLLVGRRLLFRNYFRWG